MTKRIFKYHIALVDRQQIIAPGGAKFLSAGAQDEQLVLWAVVDDAAGNVMHTIAVCGTGHEPPPDDGDWYFINTVHHLNGYIWHIFAKSNP